MRIVNVGFLALVLSASGAFAAGIGPLPAGAPAGVKQAQASDNTAIYALIGGLTVIAIAVGISSSGGSASAPSGGGTSTTTTTGTAD